MRVNARVSLVALLVCATMAVLAPAVAQAGPVEGFFAGNCKVDTCGEGAKSPSKAEAESQNYQQAGGHIPFGVTDFRLNTFEAGGTKFPVENLTSVRVDVAPGVVTNPQAVSACSTKDFTSTPVGGGAYFESTCPESSIIGVNKVETVAEVAKGVFFDVPIEGKVYNLEQGPGLTTEFGVALPLSKQVAGKELYAHTLIEGSVEWASDYHDYFVINNIPPGLIESRLTFFGSEEGTSGFVRNPSACVGPGADTTTRLTVTTEKDVTETKPYEDPVGTNECSLEPFGPEYSLTGETTASDLPDGITTEVSAKHPKLASEIDTSDLQTATVTLPEGMTMNPSAASGLEACSPTQIGIGTRNSVTCPSGSQIGTVNLEVPTLPPGSLSGPIYLGNTNAPLPISGPPYTIYLDAESARYGVKVRIKGTITPNAATGRLTASFTENPPAPFSNIAMHFDGGAFSPIANPLACGEGKSETSFTGFAAPLQAISGSSPFVTTGCMTTTPPFALSQSTSDVPATAGAGSTFTLTINRTDGQQYPRAISTALPLGLVGRIPAVPLCSEAQSAADACPATSKIGTVAAAVGAGEFPYPLTGTVYLTGPTEGAPFGMLIAVPVVAGPFNLGVEYEHAKINIDQYTARVSVSSPIPTIRGGILTRLKALAVTIDRQGFMLNPTNCSTQSTTSVLTSTLNASDQTSSAFQPEGCSSLAFKPTFTASTSGKPTKTGGASLETTLNVPAGNANVKSVLVQLPLQLPSRGSTLEKACPAATFEANPKSCSAESVVGSARANTPVLPSKLTGLAYLVGHAGAAFPDLDLVLEANGVRDILVGNTNIKNKITTTTFASTPDVPVTSITVSLPMGPHSALSPFGSLCTKTLTMPTTITAQNGVTFKQNTVIKPVNCGVQVVGQKVIGNVAYITVRTPAAGRVSGSGKSLGTVYRNLAKAEKAATIKVPLSRVGQRRRRPFRVAVRIGFRPTNKHTASTATTVTVSFR